MRAPPGTRTDLLTTVGRNTCYGCCRPVGHCLCSLIEPFTAHCNFLLLQHPHERKKYYSTVKIVRRAVQNSRLLRGIEFEPEILERQLSGQQGYLLFPSEGATDCESIVLDLKATVIVVDGTWSEAGKIVRRNPLLATLPALTFRRELRSQYRIRKQPRDHYLSTLECIGHLLRLNASISGQADRVPEYNRLFSGFNQMVEQQLKFFPRTFSDTQSPSSK